MDVLLQGFLGIIFVLGMFWTIVWFWNEAEITLFRKKKNRNRNRCICGKYHFVNGVKSYDDRRVRHSRDLCQPFLEVIER